MKLLTHTSCYSTDSWSYWANWKNNYTGRNRPWWDDLSFIVISLPENGILKDNGTEITADQLPKQSQVPISHIQVTRALPQVIAYTFQKVNDGTVDSDETATIAINITALNDTPVATAKTGAEATEQTEKTITGRTDPDEDDLSFMFISSEMVFR